MKTNFKIVKGVNEVPFPVFERKKNRSIRSINQSINQSILRAILAKII